MCAKIPLYPVAFSSEIESLMVSPDGSMYLQLENELIVLEKFSTPAEQLWEFQSGEQLIAVFPRNQVITTDGCGGLYVFGGNSLVGKISEGLHPNDEFIESCPLDQSGRHLVLWARRDESDPFNLTVYFSFSILSPLRVEPFVKVEPLPIQFFQRPRDWTVDNSSKLFLVTGDENDEVLIYDLNKPEKPIGSVWGQSSSMRMRCEALAGCTASTVMAAGLTPGNGNPSQLLQLAGNGLELEPRSDFIYPRGTAEFTRLLFSPDGLYLAVTEDFDDSRMLSVIEIDADGNFGSLNSIAELRMDSIIAWWRSSLILVVQDNVLHRYLPTTMT